MKATQNAITVTVTMSALHNRGNGLWEIECHDAGQSWWEELEVPGDWQLARKDTVRKGSPRYMGTHRLTFVSPEIVAKTRRRVEDMLRKSGAATILRVADNLGVRANLDFGLTDEEIY